MDVEEIGPLEVNQLAMMLSAEEGDTEVVRELLGADAGLANARVGSWTALCLSAYWGRIECVRLLLEHGAEVDMKGSRGSTALLLACQEGRLEVVSLLLERGADPTLRNDDGGQALMYAALGGSVPVVRLILQDGRCGVDDVCNKRETALRCACSEGHVEAARVLLLEGGADPGVRDVQGHSPLDVARARARTQCVTLLEWYEGEVERVCCLVKAREVEEASQALRHAPTKAQASSQQQAQAAREQAAPRYLRSRVEHRQALPRVEVGRQQAVTGGGGKRGRGDGGEEEEEEEVLLEVLRWVVGGDGEGVVLKEDLFVELVQLMSLAAAGGSSNMKRQQQQESRSS